MTPVRLRELLDYDPSTGVVKTRKGRVLMPDHDGLVVIFCSETKTKIKQKLERIAYTLAFGVVPRKDKKVLHKNLDISDNSSKNLSLVTRGIFLQIKEAQRNLTQGIRLSAHCTDQFDYVVSWIDQGKEKHLVFSDIGAARKFMLKQQLKYSKILTKYCVFD